MAIRIATEDIDVNETDENFSKPVSSSGSSRASYMSQATIYEYHSIVGWLHFVDKNMDKYTTCQLLYLGSKSEGIGEKVLENCKRPSDIYQFLRPLYPSAFQALAQFMYVLQGLGKCGKYCNEQFFSKCKVQPPSTEECEEKANKNYKFAFYQMLVEMCVHLNKNHTLFERLHKYICHNMLISKYYDDKTPSGLILRMLHYPEILSVDNHNQLALALDQVVDEAGLLILKHYRLKFGMANIDVESLEPRSVEDNITRPPPSSTTGSSVTSSEKSSDQAGAPQDTLAKTPTETVKDRIDRWDQSRHPGDLTRITLTEDTRTNEKTPLISNVQDSVHPQPAGNQSLCCTMRFFVLAIILVLVVAMLIVGAGLAMMILPSNETSSISSRTTVHENTNVALGTVQNLQQAMSPFIKIPTTTKYICPLHFTIVMMGRAVIPFPLLLLMPIQLKTNRLL